MKKQFIKIKSIDESKPYYIIENNEFGVVFRLNLIDIERKNGEETCYRALSSFIDSVPDGVLVKIHLKSSLSFDGSGEARRLIGGRS